MWFCETIRRPRAVRLVLVNRHYIPFYFLGISHTDIDFLEVIHLLFLRGGSLFHFENNNAHSRWTIVGRHC